MGEKTKKKNINLRDEHQRTSLHWAALDNDVEIVKLLIKLGADINVRDKGNKTPLHLAGCEGHIETVKILLQNGAEFYEQNQPDWTVLHEAVKWWHTDIIKKLTINKADVNAQGGLYYTAPLHLAVIMSRPDLIEFLINKGAYINTTDINGWSALDWSYGMGNSNISDLLTSKGAKAYMQTKKRPSLPYSKESIVEHEIAKSSGEKKIYRNRHKVFNNLKFTPKDIYSYLCRKVIGQEDAKKVLSNAIFHHYSTIVFNAGNIGNENIMLMGPTGVGKTYIIKILAEYLEIPLVFCSANEFSETGYIGKSVSDIIEQLYKKAECDVNKAEHGIVFIDEIDKIASCNSILAHHTNRDVSGRSVQEELLDLLESNERREYRYGTHLQGAVSMNVSKVLFIASGAFAGLDELINKRGNKKSMGFVQEEELPLEPGEIEVQDIINFGLLPELMGRFPVIVQLSDLSKEDLVKIMTETEDSLLEEYKKYFMRFGVKFEVTEGAINKIAEIAYERKTGARGLKSAIEKVARPFIFQLGNLSASEIVIDEKCF